MIRNHSKVHLSSSTTKHGKVHKVLRVLLPSFGQSCEMAPSYIRPFPRPELCAKCKQKPSALSFTRRQLVNIASAHLEKLLKRIHETLLCKRNRDASVHLHAPKADHLSHPPMHSLIHWVCTWAFYQHEVQNACNAVFLPPLTPSLSISLHCFSLIYLFLCTVSLSLPLSFCLSLCLVLTPLRFVSSPSFAFLCLPPSWLCLILCYLCFLLLALSHSPRVFCFFLFWAFSFSPHGPFQCPWDTFTSKSNSSAQGGTSVCHLEAGGRRMLWWQLSKNLCFLY